MEASLVFFGLSLIFVHFRLFVACLMAMTFYILQSNGSQNNTKQSRYFRKFFKEHLNCFIYFFQLNRANQQVKHRVRIYVIYNMLQKIPLKC